MTDLYDQDQLQDSEQSLRKIRHGLEQLSVHERFQRTEWTADEDFFPFLGEVLRLHEELSTVIMEVLPWPTRCNPDILSERVWADDISRAAKSATKVKKTAKQSLDALHSWLQ